MRKKATCLSQPCNPQCPGSWRLPAHRCSEPCPIDNDHRAHILQGLGSIPQFCPAQTCDTRSYHGRLPCFLGCEFADPICTYENPDKPRLKAPDWLGSNEYEDKADVFEAKVRMLKDLLLCSQHTLAFNGAGLAAAAGIPLAATGAHGAGAEMGGKGKEDLRNVKAVLIKEPTLAHHVMAAMGREKGGRRRLLHCCVNQNHDGLIQKAGFPQERMLDIHGSCYDPSNPIVVAEGYLRGDLLEELRRQGDQADLTLMVGCSGMPYNANSCVEGPAARSMGAHASSLGIVIIGPQKTPLDGMATLRIFAKADPVMGALGKELQIALEADVPLCFPAGITRSADNFASVRRFTVPYDKDGKLSTSVTTTWDLRTGQKVNINCVNNIEGAGQTGDMQKNITCHTEFEVGETNDELCAIEIKYSWEEPAGSNTWKVSVKRLGLWWLLAARRGLVEYLPIVNVDAQETRVMPKGSGKGAG